MKNYFLLILTGLSSLVFAQETYRSEQNAEYWKNRKPNAAYWQQDVKYKIDANLNDQTDIVSGSEELTYYNNSPDTLNFVYFHLYQNAFIKGSYLESLNQSNGYFQKFGKYEADGKGTEIISFNVDGQSIQPIIDYSIMKIMLPKPLLPGFSIQFNIKFNTYFDMGGDQRRRMKLFTDGAGNKQYDGVHWYPRICVYDKKFGWETDQHLGKEFYGDFGEFDVNLTLPNHYIMDATGTLLNESEVLPPALREKLDIKNFANKPYDEKASIIIEPNGSTKTWKYHAINVHDFAWTADPTYRIGEVWLTLKNEPNRKIRCVALAQEPHASGWQDAASFCAKVIETYSRDIGVYVYPKMICADARDGMEYPMLTLDGGRSPGYYGLFAHEIGHNWFFGMVGNNETYRASLDEGFTQFLTHWSMSRLTQNANSGAKKKGFVNRYYRPMPILDQTVMIGYIRDAINENDMPLNTHSDDFNGALNHGGGYGHVYYKTATMLYQLQYVLGDDLFLAAMQHYFNQWKICHPYMEDFRASIIQYTHVDLNWFFDEWMETTKRIDYGICKAKRINNDSIEIKFYRNGTMQMPIDFSVEGKDRIVKNFVIPNTYFAKKSDATVLPVWKGWGILNPTYTVKVPFNQAIRDIHIDPSNRLADVNALNNHLHCPILFTFDHNIINPLDRQHYILKWRPDVWYNNYDGLKIGLHFNGQYMQQKHVFKFTAWYNSGIGTNYDASTYQTASARYLAHYSFTYKHRFAKFTDFNFQSRMLDGLFMNKIGIEKTNNNVSYRIFAKSLRWVQPYYISAYQPINIPGSVFYPNLSSYDQWNNTLNIEIEKSYDGLGGNGKLLIGMKTTALFSDFNYANAFFQLVQNNSISKFDIRWRLFGKYTSGGNVAPESQLYAAGANPEEMSDSKFYRSTGILPANGFGYGITSNTMQAGGGLNLRGYAGYLVPVNVGNDQYYLYRGNSGAAFNFELDYDRLFPIHPKKLSFLHLDSYLFLDAGIIGTNYPSLLDGKTKGVEKFVHTPIIACGGAGFALTIKKFGKLDEPKPLVIRFDIPMFLSHAPYADQSNFMYRWVLGINRSF